MLCAFWWHQYLSKAPTVVSKRNIYIIIKQNMFCLCYLYQHIKLMLMAIARLHS